MSEDVQTFPGDVPEEWAYNVGQAARVSTGPEKAEWEPVIATRVTPTISARRTCPRTNPEPLPARGEKP